ncbi:MAG: hypothetical protein WCJ30_22125, partial [Deltaproteobacteria bacterium]
MKTQRWTVRSWIPLLAITLAGGCGVPADEAEIAQDLTAAESHTATCEDVRAPSLLRNGGFENPATSATQPDAWIPSAWLPSATMAWDDTVALVGARSARLSATEPNDARWDQTVTVVPHTLYRLTGWIKT